VSAGIATPVQACPYPGLRPFLERDADNFFGRDQEIEQLLQRLAAHRLLAVVGVSGSGKSSLIRAGVVPILRHGMAEHLPARWRILLLLPGGGPLAALDRSTSTEFHLPADMARTETSFHLIDCARSALEPGESLLVIVDQFEELFRFRRESLTRDGGNEAALFVNLLLNATDQREVPVYVILTMRSDHLGECAQFRGLPEALNDCQYLVPRMTRRQQQEAIEGPLAAQNIEIQPALVQKLLNDAADDPDHLPVLQHLLKRVWEEWHARGATGPITLEDYQAAGNWENAMNLDVERVFEKFSDPAERQSIERMFRWITGVEPGGQLVRHQRSFSELLEVTGLSRERLAVVIEAFEERGFLYTRGGADQNTMLIDLTHESVMWHWPLLKTWIAEEAETSARLRFILESARNGIVLTGATLDAALKLKGRMDALPLWSRRYLHANEAATTSQWINDSRKRRTRRYLARIGMFVLVFAIAGLIYHFTTRQIERQRDLAVAEALLRRQLYAGAASSKNQDPLLSLTLGLYAWEREHDISPTLEQIFHDALLSAAAALRVLNSGGGPLEDIAWSPDNLRLATASRDGTANIWQFIGQQPSDDRLTLHHAGPVWALAWSPDGKRIATASKDTTAKVWDPVTGKELLKFAHQSGVRSIAWSKDGKLAMGCIDGTLEVWNAGDNREPVQKISAAHKKAIRNIAWSPDGTMLATAGEDHLAKVWDIAGTQEATKEAKYTFPHPSVVNSVAFSPKGDVLATTETEKTIHLWTLADGSSTLLRGHVLDVAKAVWSPDGRELASSSADGTVRLWDAATGKPLGAVPTSQGYILGISWSSDGSRLATAGLDGTAKIWSSVGGREVSTLTGQPGEALSVAWSPHDGSRLATGGEDGTARFWTRDGADSGKTLQHAKQVWSVAWSPDGGQLLTASGDHTARIWNASTGKETGRLTPGHTKEVWSAAWSPDGAKVATASQDHTVIVWDATSRNKLLTLPHADPVKSVAWSPDSTRLITACDRSAQLWDAAQGTPLGSPLSPHGASIRSVAWSPDGKSVATGAEDMSVIVWDAATRQARPPLRHSSTVWSVAWSPDSRLLATATADGTTTVWEAATLKLLLKLGGHQGMVRSVAWSSDGKYLASAGSDKIVQIYAIDKTQLLRLVRSRIAPLPPDQCLLYFGSPACPALPAVP
jgi:WD40 repeat protein